MKTIPLIMISSALALGARDGLAQGLEQLETANTAFAFDLMNQIAQAQPDENVFLSPFSVSTALQLVNNGAAGQTKTEIQRVLKTAGMETRAVNAAFTELNSTLVSRKDVTLNLANGMWCQAGFHLKPAFAGENQKYFQAELAAVDFNQPEAAAAINSWADKQTGGKIQKVVQFPFPPRTCLILANAIYFKGQWVEAFKKNRTSGRDFHLAGGRTTQTPMMTQDGHFNYLETPDFQAVCLPYKGGLQMQLFLPQPAAGPRALLAKFLGGDTWQKEVRPGFLHRDGTVTLPKFKMECEIGMNRPLQALGMKSAFSPNADLSGIADEPTFISEVRQKSYVDVNEEGTEAAAVTTISVGRSAMRLPTERFTMILDRPFFFVISDINTGSILFMGIMNKPASAG